MGSDGWLYVYHRDKFCEILCEILRDEIDKDFERQIERFTIGLGSEEYVVRYAEYGTEDWELDWLYVELRDAGFSFDHWHSSGYWVLNLFNMEASAIERKMLWT